MEVITHYPDIERLVSSITRIADHLDQMTEIMTTTSVKVTPEKAKQINTLYGMSVARPLPDDDPEILRSEIQDLELENDRMKRRNELMEDYIHAIACIKSKKSKFYGLCDNISCPYYDQDKAFGEGACTLGSRELIEQEAADLIDKLEEL